MIYNSNSPQETGEIARRIALNSKQGDIYCLVGDLGVGKTVFTKGFAKGLNINEHITSPTFTIVNEYTSGRMPLYHFDVYRIDDIEEMDEIGYEEYFYGEGITFVEWANIITDIIPSEATWITIEKDLEQGFDYRRIIVNDK